MPAQTIAGWLAAARVAARQPPAQARLPLQVAGQVVGSVAEGVLDMVAPALEGGHRLHRAAGGWHLDGPATAGLNAIAAVLRTRGQCGPWRNEQLAVPNAQGEVIATVERGAVRVLGIATRAVHLVGLAPDGRMWVQLRSRTKPNNPGMWDTLMGGMVAAVDTLDQALARETWEEAGLATADLADVAQGGHVLFSRPSREGGGIGYMVERIDWFRATVPAGMEPANQDGEVERFELLGLDEVQQRVARSEFTQEAGLVIGAYLDSTTAGA
ncbi:NTP pyrophosphohydrolase [Acidovorax sp. CF316]|uniref:NUDIX hydrolase n=1 Tax=Acidovorax sp. CF316 TaxID=1144317 RepID=UPI00026BDAEB|nr:NUDIX domain-containing protein [Acidovorax sp. CF316]EJE53301.1 NTP pyrophosphohydrolase [Acidovorax sp. CF316]